jgi:hypothetical protein
MVMIENLELLTSHNFGLPFRSGQALTTGYATLVLVTSIAKQSRANGNVSFGHSPTTNVGNPRFVMCNGLNVAHDGSSDHGAVRRGHGSKKEKKGSGGL